MAGFGIKVTTQLFGVANVRRALDRASPDIQRRVALATRASATAIAEDARSRVPKRTGELASTLRAEPTVSPFIWLVKAGYGSLKRRSRSTGKRRRRPRVRQIGPIEPGVYAMVVEFGSRSARAKQPAQPYLFPALEAGRERHMQRVAHAMREVTK